MCLIAGRCCSQRARTTLAPRRLQTAIASEFPRGCIQISKPIISAVGGGLILPNPFGIKLLSILPSFAEEIGFENCSHPDEYGFSKRRSTWPPCQGLRHPIHPHHTKRKLKRLRDLAYQFQVSGTLTRTMGRRSSETEGGVKAALPCMGCGHLFF